MDILNIQVNIVLNECQMIALMVNQFGSSSMSLWQHSEVFTYGSKNNMTAMVESTLQLLTHWGPDKMAAIFIFTFVSEKFFFN